MEVAIVTVGDEVLAGDIQNTNATWLATQLADRGATVTRILTLPDERRLIADTVREWAAEFDAVIVTGGMGGTHDDVTTAAIADAFDRGLTVEDAVREDVVAHVADYRDLEVAQLDLERLDLDVDDWSALPEGSRPLLNPEGLCPGCVVENVYAFPGIPDEMQALFERVADEFAGDAVTTTIETTQSEGSLSAEIAEVRERFDVDVGSYPSLSAYNRLKVVGTDREEVEAAAGWLREHVAVPD